MLDPHLRASTALRGLRVGLLGGSFNPAHDGHLAMSLFALRRLQLDQVWWIVSPQNPLKPTKDMVPFSARLEKTRKFVHSRRIVVTDIEQRLGTRYTVDTLRKLQKNFPYTDFIWLMGADNLKQIPRWKCWPEIFQRVPVAIFRRPGSTVGRGLGKPAQRFNRFWRPTSEAGDLVMAPAPAWMILDNPLNNLSSTELRRKG
ncbi:MAG TPA: nicotinate-nucleotide adenylyltransferase [Alphaproteobacteria bacterium]|nr:nicotinate-nucleotide adenylyltransferase [Alphaproteobacteria bacterium]